MGYAHSVMAGYDESRAHARSVTCVFEPKFVRLVKKPASQPWLRRTFLGEAEDDNES